MIHLKTLKKIKLKNPNCSKHGITHISECQEFHVFILNFRNAQWKAPGYSVFSYLFLFLNSVMCVMAGCVQVWHDGIGNFRKSIESHY